MIRRFKSVSRYFLAFMRVNPQLLHDKTQFWYRDDEKVIQEVMGKFWEVHQILFSKSVDIDQSVPVLHWWIIWWLKSHAQRTMNTASIKYIIQAKSCSKVLESDCLKQESNLRPSHYECACKNLDLFHLKFKRLDLTYYNLNCGLFRVVLTRIIFCCPLIFLKFSFRLS